MTVTFQSVEPPVPVENCYYCFQPMTSNVMGHVLNNSDAPIHFTCAKCIKTWARNYPFCPICRAPIDLSSLFTPLDKMKGRVIDIFDEGAGYVGIGAGLLLASILGVHFNLTALLQADQQGSIVPPEFIIGVFGFVMVQCGAFKAQYVYRTVEPGAFEKFGLTMVGVIPGLLIPLGWRIVRQLF